jgi:pimeloyl-ACP methyl ester carboxylesterase
MAIATASAVQQHPASATQDARTALLAGIPAVERRLQLAGISTALLDGGQGPPLVLLHEPGSFAAHWSRVIPDLVSTHRVIAPDLPGHGASEVIEGKLDADRIVGWLGELIAHTCGSPPVLVGHLGSGALAARLAIEQSERISSLVLVDSFGLGRFRPKPRFAVALLRYATRPSKRTYHGLMRQCTVDFAGMRAQMGPSWDAFEEYTLEKAGSPSAKAALRVFMSELAVPAIAPQALERIAAPTTLIWGDQDPVNRLRVAESASERFGWPLAVIENAGDDPPGEQPEAFLRALRGALDRAAERSRR